MQLKLILVKELIYIKKRAKVLQSAIADWKTMLDEDLSVEFKKNKEELSGKKGLLESYLKTVNDGTRQVNDVISSKDVMVIQRKEELMKKMKVFWALLFIFLGNGQSYIRFGLRKLYHSSSDR